MLVVFHGALQREKYRLPRFEYKNSLKSFDGSVLFVGDPTLYLHEQLQLAWYVGTEVDDGHAIVSRLVKAVADGLGTDDVVLAGSSGGGFAALAVSRFVPGSTALAFSPQTSIERYHRGYGRKLATIAFPEDGAAPDSLRTHRHRFDLSTAYGSWNRTNRILYVQNSGDAFHLTQHCSRFVPVLGLQPRDGIFATEHARLEVLHLREGHGAPPRKVFTQYVDAAFEW